MIFFPSEPLAYHVVFESLPLAFATPVADDEDDDEEDDDADDDASAGADGSVAFELESDEL